MILGLATAYPVAFRFALNLLPASSQRPLSHRYMDVAY